MGMILHSKVSYLLKLAAAIGSSSRQQQQTAAAYCRCFILTYSRNFFFVRSKYSFLIFFLFIILFQVNNLQAQNAHLRHYTRNEGLPSTTIYQMMQDNDGFIWFGTDVGVTRFDGKKFQNFTVSDGLSDNYIIVVKPDSKGRIWFLGFNGTVSYWLKGKIYNAGSDTLLRNIIATNSFVDLFEDNENRLWFTSLYGLIILDKNKIISLNQNTLSHAGIVINGKSGQIMLMNNSPYFRQYVSGTMYTLKLRYIIQKGSGHWRFHDGSVLFISNEGVVWQSDTIQKLIIPFHGEFNNSRVVSMALSKDSLLWIAIIGKGLYCYDLKNTRDQPEIYSEKKITTGVFADREGNIWISTRNEGLFMIPAWGKKENLLSHGNSLPDQPCYAINKLNSGQLIIALDKGEIQLLSKTKSSVFKIPEYNNEFNMVHRIISRNDDIWIASDEGLIHQNAKTGCNHFVNLRDVDPSIDKVGKIINVKDIALRDNKIYLTGNFTIFEYPAKCPVNSGYLAINIFKKTIRIYSIYCDRSNHLWYSTIEGLQSIKYGSFYNHSWENVLLTKQINSIAETNDSVLVFATHGYGVLFYKNGKIVNRVTTTEGLCNDICRKVFVHKDRIYVSTPSGVSVLNYSNGKVQLVQNMNKDNFLPSDDVNDVFADDMDISVATMNGVEVISQEAFEKFKLGLPLLYITEIKVNDSIISLNGESVFPYKKNSLKVNFIGINYQQPNEVNYRYRLKNDQPWKTTENTTLEFSFMEPGDYIFQIQARIQNGNWSPVRLFSFSILPPFWNTYLFRLSIILALALLIYVIVKRRLIIHRKKIEEKTKIEKQIADLEQQALQTMMNPHYIFNVMNSIQLFINANDKEAANHYLTDFASLIRMNLAISYKRFVPLDEEIGYLNLYLKFEKLRLGDKLTYEINADSSIETSETTIPVMMIQPFIENAVWHGILPMNAKGYIRVQIDKEADDLIKIRVEDNGVGINQKFIMEDFLTQINDSHALSITVQRLNLLEKSSGHRLYLRYKHMHPENENKGTIAELILPAVFY